MISLPQVGTKAVYTFKDPFEKFVRNMLSLDKDSVELTVVSLFSMEDYILNSKRDPYTEIYARVGISEVDYKQDLKDGVYIVTFMFLDEYGSERTFRVPSNYVKLLSTPSNIEYSERVIVLGIPSIPLDLDLSPIYTELCDIVETHIGVKPTVKDVVSNGIDLVDVDEHITRETIRKNTTKVHKTLRIRLAEVTEHRDALLKALEANKIVLGGK